MKCLETDENNRCICNPYGRGIWNICVKAIYKRPASLGIMLLSSPILLVMANLTMKLVSNIANILKYEDLDGIIVLPIPCWLKIIRKRLSKI